MDLDVNCLRWARPENLERLARRLGVPLPPRGYRYQHDLVRAVVKGIEKDKDMARTETNKTADAIAERFGETGDRPQAQLRRMAALMGCAWMRETAADSASVLHTGPGEHLRTKAGDYRTNGGVFFAVARAKASVQVAAGTLTRRQFFRCFTDRPPAPKTPKAPKPPVVKVVTRQAPTVHRRTKGPVEVVVYRRR